MGITPETGGPPRERGPPRELGTLTPETLTPAWSPLPVPRAQRWSSPCGCPRVCTRGRGGCCRWSCPRCTGRAGGPCSTPTPTWWTCTRWGPTTTAWAPRCCTSTARRTPRSPRRCCRWARSVIKESTFICISDVFMRCICKGATNNHS